MKISTEELENRQVAVNIEVEDTDLDKYMGKAYKRLAGKVNIPGFRKGKVPRNVLEQHIGKDAFLREAMEDLIPEAYNEAIEEQNIDAIAQPEIEILQMEPVIFKAIVPIRPTIELGDYQQIRLEKEETETTDEDIVKSIEQVQNQNAVLEPVDRLVKIGDVVTIDIHGEHDGDIIIDRSDTVYEVAAGSPMPLPGFAEKLEGMMKGAETEFTLSYPEDHEVSQLAGKDYTFKVTVKEIKQKNLPEVDDEFAKTLGFNDLASLREKLGDTIKAQAENDAKVKFEQKLVDELVERADVQFPSVLVENEVDRLIQDDVRAFPDGMKGLESYLDSIGKTMDAYKDDWRPIATQRIVRSLILGKVADVENIEVSGAEIDEEIEKVVGESDKQQEEMRKFFEMPQARDSVKQYLMTRKTMQRLTDLAAGSDGELKDKGEL